MIGDGDCGEIGEEGDISGIGSGLISVTVKIYACRYRTKL
jgi:hypothetical protein